jgi:hypothetical protein
MNIRANAIAFGLIDTRLTRPKVCARPVGAAAPAAALLPLGAGQWRRCLSLSAHPPVPSIPAPPRPRPQEGGESISVGGANVQLGIPGADSMRQLALMAAPLQRIGTARDAGARRGWRDRDVMGWDGMGWDGMGWDGMGWGGVGGWVGSRRRCALRAWTRVCLPGCCARCPGSTAAPGFAGRLRRPPPRRPAPLAPFPQPALSCSSPASGADTSRGRCWRSTAAPSCDAAMRSPGSREGGASRLGRLGCGAGLRRRGGGEVHGGACLRPAAASPHPLASAFAAGSGLVLERLRPRASGAVWPEQSWCSRGLCKG